MVADKIRYQLHEIEIKNLLRVLKHDKKISKCIRILLSLFLKRIHVFISFFLLKQKQFSQETIPAGGGGGVSPSLEGMDPPHLDIPIHLVPEIPTPGNDMGLGSTHPYPVHTPWKGPGTRNTHRWKGHRTRDTHPHLPVDRTDTPAGWPHSSPNEIPCVFPVLFLCKN